LDRPHLTGIGIISSNSPRQADHHEKVVIMILKPGVRRMVEMDTRLLRYFGFFL
jgi:predicted unusual protein kinase regulating ubiquinone biosynthesis (AarF/ABC1/UbiB family)